MSRNRAEEKDRARATKSYVVNRRAEPEPRVLHKKLDHLAQQQV